MQLGKSHLNNVAGLTFFKMLGSGAKNGFSAIPNFGTYVLFCVWETEQHAEAFFEFDPFFKAYQNRSNRLLYSPEPASVFENYCPFGEG